MFSLLSFRKASYLVISKQTRTSINIPFDDHWVSQYSLYYMLEARLATMCALSLRVLACAHTHTHTADSDVLRGVSFVNAISISMFVGVRVGLSTTTPPQSSGGGWTSATCTWT